MKNQQLQGGSLRSWRDCCARGYFLGGGVATQSESGGSNAKKLRHSPANPASNTSYKVATLCCQNLPKVNQKISNNSVTLEVTRGQFEMSIRDTLRGQFF